MYRPSLSFWQRIINTGVCSVSGELLKTSSSPAHVYRIVPAYEPGHAAVPSVILKTIAPDWPGDPYGADRELTFYTQILPQLDLKHGRIYHTGIDPITRHRLIVMEDLTRRYTFPTYAHLWTPAEMRCVLRAYAHLHVYGEAALPPPEARSWMWTYHQPRWHADRIVELVAGIVAKGVWSPLPGIGRLAEATLAARAQWDQHPMTLVHHDAHPGNAALPPDLAEEAILVDWEMAGWGLAEIDLAFLFMQPFWNMRYVDRRQALAYYWTQRQALEGKRWPAKERQARQHYADALLALSLVPVAHRMAHHPYPPDSFPARYWRSMFGVLHARLKELVQ